MRFTPTEQQQKILDTVSKDIGGKVMSVTARAGCTKTSSARLMVETVKPKRALYFAFNKAIVEEGTQTFTDNVECKTLHALAYRYIKPDKIEDFTYTCIKENIGYRNKLNIINAVDSFFRSSSLDMYEYLGHLLEPEFASLAVKYIEEMVEGKRPKTFNMLLKYFHLLMAQDSITVEYDMVIMDEAGDTTEVAVEIFKLIKSPKKAILGDDLQTIYGFMNLVDGFKLVDDPIKLQLTKSFRCCTAIAERVEKYVQSNLCDSFEFKGFDREPKLETTAYISITNSQLVLQMQKLLAEGKRFKLLRRVKDIFAPILALATASAGREVYHKKYKFLEKERKNYAMSSYKSFFAYLKAEVDDEEIHIAIDTLASLNKQKVNIFGLLKEVEAMKPDPSITVCTGYTAKGLEFDRVVILNDLNLKVNKIRLKGGAEDDKEREVLKVGYVAATRARFYLDNCNFM